MRSSLIAVLILIGFHSSVLGQKSITLELNGTPCVAYDTLSTGGQINFDIRFTNLSTEIITGSTNGFVLHDNLSGATWDSLSLFLNGAISSTSMYDGGIFIDNYSIDGQFADTIGFGGFSFLSPGIPVGFDEIVGYIVTRFNHSQHGKEVCFDSTFYPPASSWLWSDIDGPYTPSWSGPHCFLLLNDPCEKDPPILNCPGPMTLNHCDLASLFFNPEGSNGDDPTLTLISGPGQLDTSTNIWTYQPSLADVGAQIQLVAEACDFCGCSQCIIDLTFTNNAPQFTSGCYDNFVICDDNLPIQMTADAFDCDPNKFFITSIVPSSDGITIDSLTGIINTDSNYMNGNVTYTITVEVTDGMFSDFCEISLIRSTCTVRCDFNQSGAIDVVDLTQFVDYFFKGGTLAVCSDTKDFNGDSNVNITDLTNIVDYMFRGGPPPPDCP